MKISYLALLTLILSGACSDKKEASTQEEKKETVTLVDKDTSPENDTLETGFEEETLKLPSPLQIALLFQQSGMDFSEGYTLSKEHYNQVDHSEKNSLLCLGAYSADLAYNSLHQQENAAFETLDLINIISQDLGFATHLSTPERIERFEKNSHNIDSMAHLIADLEYDIEGYIRTNNEQKRSVIIFVGAWIETLELARRSFKDDGNTDVAFLIMEQQHISQDLLDLINHHDTTKDPSMSDLRPIVSDLKDKLSVFDLEGDELEISQADFDALLNSIEMAHQQIFAV